MIQGRKLDIMGFAEEWVSQRLGTDDGAQFRAELEEHYSGVAGGVMGLKVSPLVRESEAGAIARELEADLAVVKAMTEKWAERGERSIELGARKLEWELVERRDVYEGKYGNE